MASSWKKTFILIIAVGAAVRAQGQLSASSVLPGPATATASAISPVATGPQQRPVQGTGPPVAGGLTESGGPGSSGQGAGPASVSPPSAGGPQGKGGAGPPGAHGGGQPGMEGPPGGAEAAAGGAGMQRPQSPFIYVPSFSMAVIAIVGYMIISYMTLAQCFTHRSWYLLILPQAALADLVGATARCFAVLNPKSKVAFMVQMMTFSIVPVFLGITAIMTFTRVIWWITPDDKRNKSTLKTPPQAISIIWAGAYVIPDIVKAISSFLGKPKSHDERPNPASLLNRLQSISLVVQFFAIACWTLWALRYMHKSKFWLLSREVIERKGRRLGWVCFISGVLLSIRVGYSTVEFDALYNQMSFVSQHEWMYWIFDQLPVFVIYMLFIIHHPGQYLSRDYTRFKLDAKKIEKMKRDNPWPRIISNPIRREDSKTYEVTTTEVVHPGLKV